MLLVGSAIIWLLPLDGQVLIMTDQGTSWSWPQIQVSPASPQAGDTVTVWVTDRQPWSHVLLTVDGTSARLIDSTSSQAQTWTWVWAFEATEDVDYTLTFYHDCQAGCQQLAQTTVGLVTEPRDLNRQPTKLGLVFPNPQRDWHQRAGWGIELTYATLAEEPTWGIARLVRQVHLNRKNGVRMLVRVDYAPGQSLPPVGNEIALSQYLTYLQRLSRDDRLTGVYGFIIGTDYNETESNSFSPNQPTTPEWYARVFNGYGEPVVSADNVVQVVRAEHQQVRLLVGPIRAWNIEENGKRRHSIDVPWLNYLNTMVAYLNEATEMRQASDMPFAGPDGFAIQAPGNPLAPEMNDRAPFLEPRLDLARSTWQGAQAGFRVYQDWLNIINQYPTTRNLPVYISSTNTFVPYGNTFPTENYPAGWLTSALDEVNQTPQILALIWFMDDLPDDEQWQSFSLSQPSGQLIEAAEEFDQLLRR